ncbi:O-antigen ligase family protein [Chloroflexota bacterium]
MVQLKNINARWLAILLTFALLLGGIASGYALTTNQNEQLRGWEIATTQDAELPFKRPLPGVNAELTQYSDGELKQQLDQMTELGVTWVRQEFRWSEIEPEANVFDWAKWDAIVETLNEYNNLELVAALHTSPAWARDQRALDEITSPPANVADYAQFVQTFAERYGDSIQYYQVWDEPNLTAGWGNLEPKAADYVALLQSAYFAIHAVDDDATVLTAGLAPTTETGPWNISDVLYLRAIYENGGKDYFDAVAGKPYGFKTGPEDRRVNENILNFSRFILLREEMVQQGDAGKALWGTQFGWNALPVDWTGDSSIWGDHSRPEQLAYIKAAYDRAALEWPWVGGLLVEHWQPDVSGDDPHWGFSLTRENGPIPENLFIADFLPETAGQGRHHPIGLYASYAGEWVLSEAGADFGQQGDSEAEFNFSGSDIALELRRDNYRAYLYITIDGKPANGLPQDNQGQSYLILTSDDLQPHTDIVTVAQNLEPGTHTLHLRADRGWDQWALAAYRVSTPPDTQRYTIAMLVSIGAIFLAAFLLVFLLRKKPLHLPKPLNKYWGQLKNIGQILTGWLASVVLMISMLLTWNDNLSTIMRRDPPGLLIGILTAGVLYFSPWLILTLIAGIVLWLIIYQRLEIGLLLTIFWAPFFLFPVELYHYAFPMAEVCILLTTAAWLLRLLVQWAQKNQEGTQPLSTSPQSFRRLNNLDWGMIILFILAVLSLFWAEQQKVAIREFRILIVEPLLFYLIARTTLRTREEIIRLVDVLIIAATTAAVISLIMYIQGQSIITAEGGTQRLAGIYGSPNNIGLLMGRTIPFALAYALISKHPTRRILAVVAGLCMLFTVVLSQSVGAILLGVPAGIFTVLLLWNFRYGLVAMGLTAIVGLMSFIPLAQHPRFAQLLDFSNGTTFFRLRLWQSTLQMIEDQPLTGLGLDQFLYHYRGGYILPEAWQEPNLSHPHNILLDFWTRLGFFGVVALAWLQFFFWKNCWQLYHNLKQHPSLYAVAIGAMGSMAAMLLHGLVDNSIFVQDLSYIFALVILLPTLVKTALVDD